MKKILLGVIFLFSTPAACAALYQGSKNLCKKNHQLSKQQKKQEENIEEKTEKKKTYVTIRCRGEKKKYLLPDSIGNLLKGQRRRLIIVVF